MVSGGDQAKQGVQPKAASPRELARVSELLTEIIAFAEGEEIMRKWDVVRAQIAGGNRGSGPRDAFESWLSMFSEPAREALVILSEPVKAASPERETVAGVIRSRIASWVYDHPMKPMDEATQDLISSVADGLADAILSLPVQSVEGPATYRAGDFIGRQSVLCVHGSTDPNNLCPLCEDCTPDQNTPPKPSEAPDEAAKLQRRLDEADDKYLNLWDEVARLQAAVKNAERNLRGNVRSELVAAYLTEVLADCRPRRAS